MVRFRRHVLGIVALALGACSLGLVAIPAVVFDEPVPRPRQAPEPAKPDPPVDDSGGITLSTKRFSIHLGRKQDPATRPVAAVVPAPPPRSPTKPYRVAAVAVALVGLVTATLAAVRERHWGMAGAAAVFCVGAVMWQYLVLGVVIGAAVAVLLLFLALFGGMLSSG